MEILSFPFIQRALLAGIILAVTLSFLGVYVTLKRMSFFGDGIAHACLAGIAIGILTGINPLWTALLVGILFGAFLYFFEKKTSLSSDAIIGIILTAGMALGVVLMSFQKGYQPELISFLFGNILAINTHDLLIMSVFGIGVVVFLSILRKKIALLVLDRDEAWLSGIPTNLLEFSLYIILAISVVLGVKVLGIILVSALLIIPPTTAKLFAKTFRELFISSVLIGLITVTAGLFLSYFLDLPSGAVIILTGTIIFILVFLLRYIWRAK